MHNSDMQMKIESCSTDPGSMLLPLASKTPDSARYLGQSSISIGLFLITIATSKDAFMYI